MVPSATPTTSSSPVRVHNPQPKLQLLLSQEPLGYAFQIFYAHSKTFKALIYEVHREIIFAIAQLSCDSSSHFYHVMLR